MAGKETPLSTVKRVYGSKDKLIEAAVKALEGAGETDEELSERLAGKPNSKLLRLVEAANTVKERWGSKDKMIEALLVALGKAKDADYGAKLQRYSIPRLLDLTTSAEKRARKAA